MKTCQTCEFYKEAIDCWNKRWTACENHVVEDAVRVTVADDHGLDTSVRPPPTFSCNQHVEKT